MQPTHQLLPICLLTAALSAQSYVTSPAPYDKHEARSNNTYPFYGTSFRYQQVHGDVKGTPRVLTQISFRRDGTLGTTASYGARSYDMELFVGDGDLPTFSTTFATNFVSTPVNVFTRKNLNVPDHTNRPDFLPAAWDVDVTFDVPFPYVSAKDLVWEAVIYTNTSANSYPMDAVSGLDTGVTGGFAVLGSGCTTANGTMKLRSNFASSSTANTVTMNWGVSGGPASAATVVFVGISNPNTPIPGLCNNEKLYTDAILAQIPGTTAAGGTLTTPTLTINFDPTLLAFTLTSQAAAVDASQPGLGIAASTGNAAPFTPLPGAVPVRRLYAYNNSSATTGGMETYNYGLVTRFRY